MDEKDENDAADNGDNTTGREGGGCGCLNWGFFLVIAGALAFTNPTEVDMRQRIANDGWVAVGFDRTNLIVFNWVNVNGFTGAKGAYLGIGGGIFKLPWSE